MVFTLVTSSAATSLKTWNDTPLHSQPLLSASSADYDVTLGSRSRSPSSSSPAENDDTYVSRAEMKALLLRQEQQLTQQFQLVLTAEEHQSQKLVAVKEQLESVQNRLTVQQILGRQQQLLKEQQCEYQQKTDIYCTLSIHADFTVEQNTCLHTNLSRIIVGNGDNNFNPGKVKFQGLK
jgi:hypothetical protein